MSFPSPLIILFPNWFCGVVYSTLQVLTLGYFTSWVHPPVKFFCPHDGIKIFGIAFGSTSFTYFFLREVLSKGVWHAPMLPRLKDI
jgi:hypothetical protein